MTMILIKQFLDSFLDAYAKLKSSFKMALNLFRFSFGMLETGL